MGLEREFVRLYRYKRAAKAKLKPGATLVEPVWCVTTLAGMRIN